MAADLAPVIQSNQQIMLHLQRLKNTKELSTKKLDIYFSSISTSLSLLVLW